MAFIFFIPSGTSAPVAATYYWRWDSGVHSPSSWVSTALLDDGNTSTGHFVPVEVFGVTKTIEGWASFGSAKSVTGVSFYYQNYYVGNPSFVTTGTYRLYKDGGVLVASGSAGHATTPTLITIPGVSIDSTENLYLEIESEAQGGAGPSYLVELDEFTITASDATCSLPDATQDLTRGETTPTTVDGTEAPTVDEWEIYRCVDNTLTLIDSSDLGSFGLAGWKVSVSSTPGYDYDIYVPLSAAVATDYEARIDAGATNESINFNVIAEAQASAEDREMPERPVLGEHFRYGFQPNKDQAVQANRLDPALRMNVPDPMMPSTTVMENGGDSVIDLIPHKEHTQASVSGPMHYMGIIEQFYQLLGEPFIKAVPGASLARDVIWVITSSVQDAAARTTIEQGQRDGNYPSRFDTYEHQSVTLSFGKTDNNMEFSGIGHRLNERLTTYSLGTPTEVSFIPVNAAQNNHYLGTAPAYWGVGTAPIGCDLHEATLTLPQRRQALFTQCTDEGRNSFKDTVRISATPTLTIALSHREISRGQMDYIRNKVGQIYQFLNRSTINIETGFPYEFEVAASVVADDRGSGDTDAVTTGIHNFMPKRLTSFDPWSIGTPGVMAFRVRAPFTVKPTSTNISNF